MFENNAIHTEMTINHHWVPMAIFERLIEGHPNGNYKGITNTTVVFKVENGDEAELNTFTENWFCRQRRRLVGGGWLRLDRHANSPRVRASLAVVASKRGANSGRRLTDERGRQRDARHEGRRGCVERKGAGAGKAAGWRSLGLRICMRLFLRSRRRPRPPQFPLHARAFARTLRPTTDGAQAPRLLQPAARRRPRGGRRDQEPAARMRGY